MLSARGVTHLPGQVRTRMRGRGLDFDEMRPYAKGDDVRHIDWNVTARTGRTHVRLFREERERAMTVAVDLRRSMFTGSARLKAVAAGEYAAALLWRVFANRDSVGAMAFDDHETTISRPASRQRGVLAALGVIAERFPAALAQKADDVRTLDDMLARINALPRSAGLIVLLTGADDPGPAFDDEAAMAAPRGRLAVLRLVDPLESDGLPAGRYAYQEGGRSRRTDLDPAGAAALKRALDEKNGALEARFAGAGLPLVTMPTDAPAGEAWTRLAQHGLF